MAGLALGSMLSSKDNLLGDSSLSAKGSHFRPKAKRVIHIFLNGGPSHVDTFDPKPALNKYAGKLLPIKNLRTERKTGAAFPSPFKFKRYGQSGIEVVFNWYVFGIIMFPHALRKFAQPFWRCGITLRPVRQPAQR